jgi:hypothetical protein
MRGAVERTYALNELEEHRRTGQQEAVGLSAERYHAALAMVLAQIAVDFERAVERGDLADREDELSMGAPSGSSAPNRSDGPAREILSEILETSESRELDWLT